jgi:DNA-binding response OmpR family regulator
VLNQAAMTTLRRRQAITLVIEDDRSVAQTLNDGIGSEGFRVVHASSATQAKALLDQVKPDLIILDLMLPDADGLVLCSDLKARTDAPIIVCSATNRKRDAILALKLGADDFISKPFDVEELLTRIEAVRRRAQRRMVPQQALPVEGLPAAASAPNGVLLANGSGERGPTPKPHMEPGVGCVTIGSLRLEHSRRRVTIGSVELQLTPTEYRLLSTMITRPDEVFSRGDLAQYVWGYDDAAIGRSIDVHVHRLRVKMQIAQAPAGVLAPTILSVRGFGYRLSTEVKQVERQGAA